MRASIALLVAVASLQALAHTGPDEAQVPCPSDVRGWGEWRERLKALKDFRVFEREIAFLRSCTLQASTQKLFEDNLPLGACMKDLVDYSVAVAGLESAPESAEWKRKTAEQVMPAQLLDGAEMRTLNKKSPAEQKKFFDNLVAKNPGSTAQKYTSNFVEIHGNTFYMVEYLRPEGSYLINVQVSSERPNIQGLFFSKNNKDVLRGFRYNNGNFENNSEVQATCASCHVAGFIPLRPLAVENPAAFEALNIRYKQNRRTYMSEIFNKLGVPGLGTRSGRSREAIVARCAPDADEKSRERILSAMNCAKCHRNGKDANVIGGPEFANTATLRHILENGEMPPPEELEDGPLSARERIQLFDCIMAEYLGQLDRSSDWQGTLINHLTRVACPLN